MREAATGEARDGGREGARAIRLRLPAAPEFVPLARLVLAGLAQVRDLSDELLTELKSAVAAADSAAATRTERPAVEVSYVLHGDRLEIEVAGAGAGARIIRPLAGAAEADETPVGVATPLAPG